jgi:hypothetical protein
MIAASSPLGCSRRKLLAGLPPAPALTCSVVPTLARTPAAPQSTRKCEGQPVTVQQLELLRHGVEAQLRWALVYCGDQELIDLLRDHSDRLL